MKTIARLAAACLLLAAAPSLAEEAADPAAELAAKRERLEKLREERDAALMNANIYVLPKYKLEAEQKQQEIDALEKEIEALEAATPGR